MLINNRTVLLIWFGLSLALTANLVADMSPPHHLGCGLQLVAGEQSPDRITLRYFSRPDSLALGHGVDEYYPTIDDHYSVSVVVFQQNARSDTVWSVGWQSAWPPNYFVDTTFGITVPVRDTFFVRVIVVSGGHHERFEGYLVFDSDSCKFCIEAPRRTAAEGDKSSQVVPVAMKHMAALRDSLASVEQRRQIARFSDITPESAPGDSGSSMHPDDILSARLYHQDRMALQSHIRDSLAALPDDAEVRIQVHVHESRMEEFRLIVKSVPPVAAPDWYDMVLTNGQVKRLEKAGYVPYYYDSDGISFPPDQADDSSGGSQGFRELDQDGGKTIEIFEETWQFGWQYDWSTTDDTQDCSLDTWDDDNV